MKELKFMKKELKSVSDLLIGFKLKGKESRLRMNLVRELESAIGEFGKDEKQLFEEFVIKGEDGSPISIKKEVNGETVETYDFDDEERFLKEIGILYDEVVIIDHKKYEENLRIILKAIDESEVELSGHEAILHSLLYDKINEVI